MTNRTAEEVRMENKILRKILFPCKVCGGTGRIHLSPVSNIGCPECEGFNADAAKEALDV